MSVLITLAVGHRYSHQGVVWCVATGGESNAKHFGRSLLRQYHTQRTGHGAQFGIEAVLAKLIESQQEIDSITALENFILGFRLGVRIMTECMDDNDGDIKTGGE